MSSEVKITIGIIVASIIIAIVGVKLAYRTPTDNSLLLSAERIDNVNSPRRIGKNSKITIVEFADFECPACYAMHPVVEKLLADEGDNITYVYRNFPIHQNADKLAVMALAAGKQNKFWEMYNILFDRQNEWAVLSPSARLTEFDKYATEIGLNMAQYKADLKDPALAAQVSKDTEDAQAMGINSTPTFIINGKTVLRTTLPYEQFKNLVDTAPAADTAASAK